MNQRVFPVFGQDVSYQVALSRLTDRINEVHQQIGGTIERFTDPQVKLIHENGKDEYLASSIVMIRQNQDPVFRPRSGVPQ